jgi:hypothetical protein
MRLREGMGEPPLDSIDAERSQVRESTYSVRRLLLRLRVVDLSRPNSSSLEWLGLSFF